MLKLKRTISALVLAALTVTACNARKRYPDPQIGWHNGDYSVVFGRLEPVAASGAGGAGADATQGAPTWTIVFADPSEPMSGQLALSPPEKMLGYSGGERVEVRGHLLNQPTTDRFNGRWYVVDSIRMWEGKR